MAAARPIGLLAAVLHAASLLAASPLVIRIEGDRVNLRAQPIENAEVVGQMMTGDLLVTPDPLTSNAWVRVIAPQSVDLWVYSELIRDGRITVNKAQVRGGPGIQFQRVGELLRETPVTLRGTVGDWSRIAPTETCFLWVSREYVVPILPDVPSPPPRPPEEPVIAATTVAIAAPPVATNAVPTAVLQPQPTATEMTRSAAQSTPGTRPSPPAASPEPRPSLPPPASAQEPRFQQPPPLPQALQSHVADAHRPQYELTRFAGILKRVNAATGPRYSAYQIVAGGTGRNHRDVLCRLIGLDGQLSGLVGHRVEVQGRIWHLAGEPVPVLDANRLLMLPETP